MHSSDELSASIPPVSASRAAILAASRRPEAICVKSLIEDASLPAALAAQAETTARQLAAYMRGNAENNGVESMMQAFPPGSEEGAAIMTLAEALLRIPDSATRDALIRDQTGHIEWQRHTGRDKPALAHAAAWAMAMAARLHSGPNGLRALATWGGAPLIRRRVEQVVKTITSQFTPGETMAHALRHAAPQERRGFRHTYAPLCEPALTGADGARQRHDLTMALEALARHAQDTTVAPLHERPELAVRLSSLHPRLEYMQRRHILTELLPTLGALAAQARALNIGLVFDAEESACLNISLDVFEALCALPELKGWNGLGLTVQASMRHAPALIDHIVELARQGRRRITVRLVKGDFQDDEIKRAQVERHADFPVFTRKNHTDISYLACARRLLDAPDALFPQFATHNARTVATILALTEGRSSETYEFQCLHGVAETLYAPLVSRNGLNLPCRIYAPVGTQEHMTSYLMRRLTESSARSSFVQQIANHTLPLDTVIADPVRHIRTSATPGAPEPKLRQPRHLFAPGWISAQGTNLDDPAALDTLYNGMGSTAITDVAPITPGILSATEAGWDAVPDPSDPANTVGAVRFADDHAVQAALASADAASSWARTAPADRARCLEQAATLLEDGHAHVVSLLIRESGHTLSGALDEIRNAADHLRYHAAQIRQDFDPAAHAPLGVMLCISPWNLPLSVLTGQMAAALAAGNTVIAKPSEKTPLVAAIMVRLLLKAGVPPDALHLLPGNDLVGAELVADPRVDGVLFTGTTATARTVSRALLGRRGRTGQPIPLITATGALNAMLVDSSASPAQAVRDIVISAFGNAGTDCASLRILLVQDEIADQIIDMLCGAMRELRMGDPSRPDTDIGPLISADARLQVDDHIDRMRRAGRHVWQATPVPDGTNGHFVPPTLIEIGRVADIGGEVLGPVLHLRRFARGELDGVVDAVNATGYALSFGVQSRVRSTIARVCARSNAGNLYVNRDMTRAAVGSRPFGGKGLSGTGPKTGSRLLLARLTLCKTDYRPPLPGTVPAAARALLAFLEPRDPPSARRVRGAIANALQGSHTILAGPVGETNRYSLRPRGNVICAGESWPAILYAVGMALGTGNTALVLAPDASVEWMTRLPRTLSNAIRRIDAGALPECDAMLVQVGCELAEQAAQTVTAREGLVVPVYDAEKVRPEWLLDECVLTTNTAAIGGDVTLSALH